MTVEARELRGKFLQRLEKGGKPFLPVPATSNCGVVLNLLTSEIWDWTIGPRDLTPACEREQAHVSNGQYSRIKHEEKECREM